MENLENFFDLLKDIKKVSLQLEKYKGNPNYKKSFLNKVKQLNREYKFLKAKIAKESNQQLKKTFKKIIGSIETIIKYKNPETSLEEIDYIEEHWPEIEIALAEYSEELIERIYDKGSRFDFHLDIKNILSKTKKDLFIIDSWANEDLLELYLKNMPKNIFIRILVGDKPKGKIVKIGNMFVTQYGKILEIRESSYIHDRAIFCDSNSGWVMGQSIKDGAKKPTYLIKLRDPKRLKDIYETIWKTSKKIV